MNGKGGRVYLVGAGPGSPDLVTLRARELIAAADVIVYDYLVDPALLDWARPDAEIIHAGKMAAAHTLTQEEINALLVARGRAGRSVVRLKGGDPYVFGRGGEEGLALAREGLAWEVVPGVSSAIAAPALAGIPVTHRGLASQVTFVTGHEDPAKPESAIDWAQLARLAGTKVFLMGVERLRRIADRLLAHGAAPATPVALVRWGTTARQESLAGTLATIADLAEQRGFRPPAVTVVGDVVNLRDELNWFEKLPLFGRRVVVTRARTQASGLRDRLARLGADVLAIPTIRIVPVALTPAQQAKLAGIGGHFDWLVFSSPNGVDRFFEEMISRRTDIRALGAVRIAALGPATAAPIEKFGLRVDLQPRTFTQQALAGLLDREELSGKRFCLIQGTLADPGLAAHLQSRGAVMDSWIIYKTEPETEDRTGHRARFVQEGAQVIAFTSASTVDNWHALKLRPEAGASEPRVVSIGPVTTARLRQLGYPVQVEAENATLDSLVEAIRQSV